MRFRGLVHSPGWFEQGRLFQAAPVPSIPPGQALARLKSGALIFHVNVTLPGALLVMTATVPTGLELRWSVI